MCLPKDIYQCLVKFRRNLNASKQDPWLLKEVRDLSLDNCYSCISYCLLIYFLKMPFTNLPFLNLYNYNNYQGSDPRLLKEVRDLCLLAFRFLLNFTKHWYISLGRHINRKINDFYILVLLVFIATIIDDIN